jgi:uncharacterized delta-60 repeat protein
MRNCTRIRLRLGSLLALFGLLAAGAVLAQDGDLDSGFGSAGRAVVDFGGTEVARGIALQQDGKIVLSGVTSAGGTGSAAALARLNADGSPDMGFGTGARVIASSGLENGEDVAVQQDGRILVAGGALQAGDRNLAVGRYLPDGSPDASFGPGGLAVADFDSDSAATAVAVQDDGKILAAGSAGLGQFDSDFALARFNADGTPDNSFGFGGRVLADFSFGGRDTAWDMAVQPDGKIVLAGESFHPFVGVLSFALARFNADGTPDLSFGNQGQVLLDLAEFASAYSVALQADGRIVAAGSVSSNNPQGPAGFCVARLNADGTPDTFFNSSGVVITDFGPGFDEARALGIQPDGRIVAAGPVSAAGTTDFGVVRYLPDGTPDPSFGTGGKALADFAGGADFANALTIQPDGGIVAAGQASAGDFGAARFTAGTPTAPPHTLTFFLQASGTKGSFDMSQTQPATSRMAVNLSRSPAWSSDRLLNGTLPRGAAFTVSIRRALIPVNPPTTFRLSVTNPDGSGEQVLGTVSVRTTLGPQTATIPVRAPLTLENKRLKLTIWSHASCRGLQLGAHSYVRVDQFTGTP